MTILFEERPSDSPYIETVIRGRTVGGGSTIRPAESHWHMVFLKMNGQMFPIVTGVLPESGITNYGDGGELLWIKFKLGTFMPSIPIKSVYNREITLPEAARHNFWLHGSAWEFPTFENVETFAERLVRADVLMRDTVVVSALRDEPYQVAERTVRHRFLHATGLTQNHIRQLDRASRAADLLRQGVPILDVVYDLGYTDQPHLTKSLKRFIGRTPSQLFVRTCTTDIAAYRPDADTHNALMIL